jgi:Zn-dependent protease
MPVDPTRFRSRYGDLIVSAAGPIMNASLAATCIVLGGLWVVVGALVSPNEEFFINVAEFFLLGAALNVVLVVLNLAPIPPLDGSRMMASVSTSYRRMTEHVQAPLAGLFAIVAVFVLLGDAMWGFGFEVAGTGIVGVAKMVGGSGEGEP